MSNWEIYQDDFIDRFCLLGSRCGLFNEGRGKSVRREEKQSQDEEHGDVSGGGDRDGGLMRDIDSEKDSEKVFSGALSYPD